MLKFFKIKIFITHLILILALSSALFSEERKELWIDLYSGEPAGFDAVIEDLKDSRIIYLGEIHTIKRHHNLQLKIINTLIKSGKKITLALEQMEAFNQDKLDLYNNNKIDFEKLAEETQWEERWPNYMDYKDSIEEAHKNGCKIIALNARAEIIRKIARKGIEALSASEREQLPVKMDFEKKKHKKLLNMILKVHAMMNPHMLDTVIKAQMTRDEMMAHEIYKYINVPDNKDSIVIVLGGSMHFSYGLGVPERLKDRMPGIRDRIILFSESGDLVLSRNEKAMAREIVITHQDLRFLNLPIADYLNIIERKTSSQP